MSALYMNEEAFETRPTLVPHDHDNDILLSPLLQIVEPDVKVCETPPVGDIEYQQAPFCTPIV